MEQVVLQNDLVYLRSMQMDDAEALFDAGNNPDIWTHIAYDLLSLESTIKYVHSQVTLAQAGERYAFVIIDKITNKIIGATSLFDLSLEHARAEIGSTWLKPSYWRTSVNTTCKYLLLQFAFETLQLERVQLKTDNLNERSQQAIERLGAVFEGELRNHMRRKDGTMRNTMMYSIVKEEWPKVGLALQEKLTLNEDR